MEDYGTNDMLPQMFDSFPPEIISRIFELYLAARPDRRDVTCTEGERFNRHSESLTEMEEELCKRRRTMGQVSNVFVEQDPGNWDSPAFVRTGNCNHESEVPRPLSGGAMEVHHRLERGGIGSTSKTTDRTLPRPGLRIAGAPDP